MKTPLVYIIILNWNGLKDTLACLNSVYKSDYPNFEVIVVDNASSDDSPKIITENYPSVILIKNSENLGFAGGNNVGMRYAMEHGAKYIWLLNNDTIIEKCCLSKIIDMAESSNDIGLVSPMIYYSENPTKVQFGGSYIDWKQFRLIFPPSCVEIGSEFQTGKDVCLWGTALLIKRSVVEKIGYLKDEYFAYWEDTDYSIRALITGYKNVVCASSRILHELRFADCSGIKKGKHYYYYMIRNRLLLENEYILDFWARFNSRRKDLANLLDYIGYCYKHSAHEHLAACLDGAWHGLTGISGEMTEEKGMPIPYKKFFFMLAKHHPYFLADLIRLNFKKICKRILKREI